MLKVNKDKKEFKVINPTAFIALLSATTLAFSSCSNKKEEVNKFSDENKTSQILLSEEDTSKNTKYSDVVKTDWHTYKESALDYLDSKAINSLEGDNLETALLILNMSYLKSNNIAILDSYFKKSNDIDQNDEMNQLYKLLSSIRENNTNINNTNDFISFEKLLFSIDSENQNEDYKVINYLETKIKELISNKEDLKEENIINDFNRIKEFACGNCEILGLYQVDLSNDAIIASENLMQQYSVLVKNYISFEQREELDKILNSHNYLYNVEMNIAELNGYARPTSSSEEIVNIEKKLLHQREVGYEEVIAYGVTKEEYYSFFAIAIIYYFVKDINNNEVFKKIYGEKIDIDSIFENAESAVQKIQAHNFSSTSEEIYDYGHIYISSVGDIINTRYVVNLSYDISTSEGFTTSINKLKLYNQYSEELDETTYTYKNETYRIAKNSIGEGATQVNNWISYYTFILNRKKINNDNFVDNMISLVDGSQDGLNPYDEIVLMVTDFCANKNEGAFQYKIGQRK